jgi:hypothetical protein
MLVRDGEQTSQPLRIFPVCDLGVEQFEDVPLSRLQVEIEAVAQSVQVAVPGEALKGSGAYISIYAPDPYDLPSPTILCSLRRMDEVLTSPFLNWLDLADFRDTVDGFH